MDWKSLEPKFLDLLNQNPQNLEQLEQWFLQRSSLLMQIEEEAAWRYINMTRHTDNKHFLQLYQDFVQNIQPNVIKYQHKLDLKLIKHPLINQLEQKYFTAIRLIRNQIKLYNEKNIPLFSKEQTTSQQFAQITSKMTIRCKGQEYTLQQASKFLYDPKRSLRKKIYNKIASRRLKDYSKLNSLLDQLIDIRNQIALNAGFQNYRDYKHTELGRFDYSIDQVLELDKTIALAAVPYYNNLLNLRKQKLNLKQLKPWDLQVDFDNTSPLKPFDSTDDFINKAIKTLSSVKPQYGHFLKTMADKGMLDLESRKNKAPGGYNYPLLVSNMPFIFMNAAGTINDVITLMHESGHAIHAFLSAHIPVIEQKEPPSEIAELASMSMELISMEHWHIFFPDKNDLKRAKRYQLERILEVLPWIALIDSFQHWIYSVIPHSSPERYAAWLELATTYFPDTLDWTEIEWYLANLWQKQLHIFEVPFYYIEYAIAQLGAIAIWKNYKQNPQKTLQQYEKALSLGYTKPIPQIYQTAGIKFDFSIDYIQQLLDFVWQEYLKQI